MPPCSIQTYVYRAQVQCKGWGNIGEMREMKKTTRDNDERDIMGNTVRRTIPSLCAKRRALRREAERQLRSTLGIPHSHPPGPQQGEDGRQGEGGMVGIRPGHRGHGVNRTRKGEGK